MPRNDKNNKGEKLGTEGEKKKEKKKELFKTYFGMLSWP